MPSGGTHTHTEPRKAGSVKRRGKAGQEGTLLERMAPPKESLWTPNDLCGAPGAVFLEGQTETSFPT